MAVVHCGDCLEGGGPEPATWVKETMVAFVAGGGHVGTGGGEPGGVTGWRRGESDKERRGTGGEGGDEFGLGGSKVFVVGVFLSRKGDNLGD